jgi:hypothetical protein
VIESWLGAGVPQIEGYAHPALGIRQAWAPLPRSAGGRPLSAHMRLPPAFEMKPPVQIGFSSRIERSGGTLQVHWEQLLRLHVANQL